MRVAAGSIADFANVTWPANANATLSLSLVFATSSLVGIPANLLVLYISFRSPLLDGNYKYFLANLSVCDLATCFAVLFQLCDHLYHLLNDVLLDISKCYLLTVFPYTFGMCMVAALPIASINRYCVVCRRMEEWFTRERIVLLCMTAYFPLLFPIIDILFASKVVYYSNLCFYNFFTPFNPEWIIVVLGIYVYPTLIFCNIRVYKKLSAHMNTTGRGVEKRQMENERSILKALVIQATIPVLCCLPIAILLLLVLFSGTGFDHNVILTKVVVRFSDTAILTTMDLCFIFFMLNQTLDALVTLTIAKPYKRAVKQLFFSKTKVGDEVANVSIIAPNSRK